MTTPIGSLFFKVPFELLISPLGLCKLKRESEAKHGAVHCMVWKAEAEGLFKAKSMGQPGLLRKGLPKKKVNTNKNCGRM